MTEPVEILLVDDNPADVELLSEALAESGWRHRLTVAEDGAEALDALNICKAKGNRSCPDLILMDVNLPVKSGHEVLAEIRADPVLARVPVVVVSGSPWERKAMADLGIPEDRYIVKPMTFPGYCEAVRRIREVWNVGTSKTGA